MPLCISKYSAIPQIPHLMVGFLFIYLYITLVKVNFKLINICNYVTYKDTQNLL